MNNRRRRELADDTDHQLYAYGEVEQTAEPC
jgi:hypothetical protein